MLQKFFVVPALAAAALIGTTLPAQATEGPAAPAARAATQESIRIEPFFEGGPGRGALGINLDAGSPSLQTAITLADNAAYRDLKIRATGADFSPACSAEELQQEGRVVCSLGVTLRPEEVRTVFVTVSGKKNNMPFMRTGSVMLRGASVSMQMFVNDQHTLGGIVGVKSTETATIRYTVENNTLLPLRDVRPFAPEADLGEKCHISYIGPKSSGTCTFTLRAGEPALKGARTLTLDFITGRGAPGWSAYLSGRAGGVEFRD